MLHQQNCNTVTSCITRVQPPLAGSCQTVTAWPSSIGGGSGGALGGLLLLTVGARMRRATVVVCLVLEHLFVLKMPSHTQRATEVKKFVDVSLKPLHCRDPTPSAKGHMNSAESAHVHYALTVRTWRRGSALQCILYTSSNPSP